MSQHEQDLEFIGLRKEQGSFYTPHAIVDGLLRLCLDPLLEEASRTGIESVASIRILDPTCGTGNFLIPAFGRIRDFLQRMGLQRDEASHLALNSVIGVDLDPVAVEISRSELMNAAGSGKDITAKTIQCADSLVMPVEPPMTLFRDPDATDWSTIMNDVGASAGFDLVVGNPPFLSQLHSETAFSAGYMRSLEQRFGRISGAYTDSAALFLLVGRQILRSSGGRLCLIGPVSTLSSQSARGVRAALSSDTTLTKAWFAEQQIFEGASVEVWASIWETGVTQNSVEISAGPEFEVAAETTMPEDSANSWGGLLAALRGVPLEQWRTDGLLGDVVDATADFRDQYYGLSGHVYETKGRVETRLVTSGLIDPANLLWGQRSTKFDGQSFRHPIVMISELEPAMQRWAERRLVPKVLLATQTRVLEPIVDEAGDLLPSVPVVTVEPKIPEQIGLWHVAALLVSPPISAIAATRHFGAALSSDALKLSARDVLELPRPALHEPWDSAAKAFRRAAESSDDELRRNLLIECGQLMCLAFGVERHDHLVSWWIERLPAPRQSDHLTSEDNRPIDTRTHLT